MTELDSEYFDLYKDIDDIVKTAYQNERGLSYYIDCMKELDELNYQNCCRVDNWKCRFQSLKHLRWVRNQISHNKGDNFANEQDYNDLQNFRNELLNGVDPLAEYRIENEVTKINAINISDYNSDLDNQNNKKSSNIGRRIFNMLIFVLIILICFIVIKNFVI